MRKLLLVLLLNFVLLCFYCAGAPCYAADWQSLCVKGDLDAIRAALAEPVNKNNINAITWSADANPANAILQGGNRPIHIAAEYAAGENGAEIIKLLVNHGADLNAKGLEGLTPLMLAAAYNSNAAVTETLLELCERDGAKAESVDMIDANGRTPLHIAASLSDEPDVLAALLRSERMYGMLRARDKDDRTALWLAAARGDDKMLALILDALTANFNQEQARELVNTPNREEIMPLHAACERPDVNVIDLLVRAGADVNARDPHRYTPLMLAVSANADAETLRVLINNGADLFAEDDQNRGALYLAVSNTENETTINFLLDALSLNEINTLDSAFMTPLMQACRTGNFQIARILIERGANVNLTDRNGYSALTFAALANAPRDIFDLLIKHGATANFTMRQGATPLMLALDSPTVKPETIKMLIECGADPNYKNFQDINALMLILAGFNNKASDSARVHELVKILLDCGADPDLATWDGLTPLMIAARVVNNNNAREIFKLFADAGANVNLQNNQGMTALMVAAVTGNETAVECLLNASADVSLRDIDGMTALCHAVQAAAATPVASAPDQAQDSAQASNNNFVAITERLLVAGSDVNVQMNRGMTPLMDATISGQTQILKTLLEHGADISIRDSVGWTPLHFAARAKTDIKCECLKILLELAVNKKFNLDTGDNGGTTPLMVAAACDNKPAVEILLNAGAERALTDRTGRDAISYAVLRNSRECLPVLEAQRDN